MESAQAASNAEGKSSMGDKYETTRAMMQAERNRAAGSLSEAQTLLAELDRIAVQSPDRVHDTVQTGSLVQTGQGWFYIAVAAGKVHFEGKDVFAVSPQSPVARLLIGLKAGSGYQHMGKKFSVISVQ